MTEQMVPMGGTAVAEPPAPVAPLDVEETGDANNRRKLLAVGAVLAVLVVAVAGFFLMKGGSSASDEGFVAPHHAAPAATKAHHHKATKPVKLPKAFKGHVGRDPMKPLYTAPVAAPSAAPSTAPSTSPTTGSTGTPTGTTNGTTTGSTPTVRHYHAVWVELVRTNGTKSANFVVGYSNGKSFITKTFSGVLAPKPGATSGTTFAKNFALLSVQNGEVTVQFGDGTPVDLAPGAANRLVVR